MAGDSLAERIEAVEQRLQSLREHAQAMPVQQPVLAAAARDLALALDGLRAARDELQPQEQREPLLAQVFPLADVAEQVQDRQEHERLLAKAHEQREQAQQSSRETKAVKRLLQALIEAMPIGVIVADNDGRLVTTNAAAQAILGSPLAGDVSQPERTYTPHNPDGSPFPPQDMPLVRALHEVKVVPDVEILIRRADGTERFILASAAPVRDETGEVVNAVTVFQDITERRQAEEARLDALLRLSQASDASLQEIASFTLEQGIALTNSRIGFVGFLNEDESVYTLHAVSKDVVKECNVTGDPIQWHVVDAGIWADAIRERRTLFVNDYSQAHPRKRGLPTGHPYVERFMVVPILDSGRIVAIAGVGNKASDYDDSDERQIILLLSGMWGYIQRNRSREELEQAYGELEGKVQRRTAELSVSNAALKEESAERKRAEEDRERLLAENRRQRAFLEQLIETAPVGLAVVRGTDHRFEMVNQAYQAIPGMPDPPMVGRTIAQVFPSVVAQGTLAMVEQVYQTGQAVSVRECEASVGLAREQTYWDVDHVPLHGPDGAVNGVLILATEVTDQVLARRQMQELAEALAKERDVLQTIMENTSAQLAYLDPEFNFVHVNAAYAEGSGHAKEELIGRNHFDLFPNPQNQAIFEGVRDIGQPVAYQARPFEYTDQPERGTTYWDWTLVPVESKAGKVQGLVISLRDVTERRRHLSQLETERARLRTVIDSAPEAIVVADQESRIVLANPAAEQLFARPLPYGQGFQTQVELALCDPGGTPYDPRQLPLTRSALDGQTLDNVEMAVCWPSGDQRDLLLSSAPIRDRQGCITGAVGVFQDITERRRTQRALQRYAERLRILHKLDQAILVARSAREIAEAAVDHVQQLVPCLRASVVLFDLEKGEISLLAARAAGETRLAKGWRRSIGSEWPIEKLAQGQIHVVEEARDLSPSSPLLQTLQGEGVRSYINVPLLAQGTLLGSLNLGMASPGSPSPENVDIAREMATQLAVGIQQARLHQQVERHAEELEQRVARRTTALQASQRRLRAIFDSAAIGIALADVEGRILESNPAFQAMLGYKADELRELVFADFTYPEDAAADMDLFRERVAGTRVGYSLE
ncbi:MAG: PAS domain S-box protein [Anaerolineae bacterium]